MTKFLPIPALKFVSTIIGFVVAGVVAIHTISESSEHSLARCQSNVDLAAQHIERVTQQSARVVKGVAAWLMVNPHVVFASDHSLLALSPVMNIDPQDSHAIAIIEENGKAWLLDKRYAGKSFDVSARPYFKAVQSTEVGEITFGPRTKNANTGQDTIAIFYKVLFNNNPIVISTAFSVDRVKSFLTKAIGDSKSTLQVFNEGHLEILASTGEIPHVDAKPIGEKLLPKMGDSKARNAGLFTLLEDISCWKSVQNTPFILVATTDPYETFEQSIPLILAIFLLTTLATATNTLSYQKIGRLVSELREERRDLIETEEALRKSERRLSHHIQNTPLGCISWDRNFICTEWNKAAEKIFGFSADGAIGHSALDLIVPVGVHDEVDIIFKSLLEQEGGVRSTNENVDKDGRVIICDWHNTPIVDENGNVTGVTSLVQDLTEREQLEDKLRQSQRMEAVGQLTGGVAHDFNNLLGIMVGNAEMLGDKVAADENAKANINAILKAIGRASSLTSRLLAFSRQQSLSLERIDVAKLLIDLEDMLRRTIGETIDLHIETSKDLWRAIVDPHQLDNALLNLVLNARDAMPDGGTLTIEASNSMLDEIYAKQYEDLSPGEYIKLAVSDNGTGMTSEVREKAFEPFFTTKDVGEGSGLGLSMVFGMIKQSNGHISVTSQKGRGTTISLYLPASHEEIGETKDPLVSLDTTLGRKTILLVEDDPDVRKTTATMLTEYGCRIFEVEDGPEALKALKALTKQGISIDLVLSDVVMPNNMSGVELADEIALKYKNIQILLTSGYLDKIANQEELKAKGFVLIAKPYKRAQLIAAIEDTKTH